MDFAKFGAKARQHCIVCYHFNKSCGMKLVVDGLDVGLSALDDLEWIYVLHL